MIEFFVEISCKFSSYIYIYIYSKSIYIRRYGGNWYKSPGVFQGASLQFEMLHNANIQRVIELALEYNYIVSLFVHSATYLLTIPAKRRT